MDTTRDWHLKDLLSELMGAIAQTEPVPRQEIWASELGKPYIDRWLQMKGVPYSNPVTGEGLMTFLLGRQIEIGIGQMLTRCGIAFRAQERVELSVEGCLPVAGRPDLIAAVSDWGAVGEYAEQELATYGTGDDLPELEPLRRLLATWQARHPQGLPCTVFEVKSLNSYAFRHHRGAEGLANAYPHHHLQLYTYLRGLGIDEGHLLHVARDTGWIEEVVLHPTPELEHAWLEDVTQMSAYILKDRRPPLEPLTINGKENWRVRYSRYRDYLYQEGQDHGAFAF
jgi:hypothetical protein